MTATIKNRNPLGKIKLMVSLIGLGPLSWSIWQAYLSINQLPNQLGPEPGLALVHTAGAWALYFLVSTLLMTPLRQLTKKPWWIGLRRTLGLWSCFYALVHLLCYWWFVLGWQWQILLEDFTDRPYISAGLFALLLMLPLALTSSNWAQRKLKQNWRQLHKLVYWVAIGLMVHILWQAERNILGEAFWPLILLVLLIWRLYKNRSLKYFLPYAEARPPRGR